MSVISNNQLAGAAGQGGAAGYQVDRSLRFHTGDSSHLSKTFSSAGNRKTWTWSCWFKRTVLGTKNQRFFSCLTGSNDNTYLELRTFDNDTICLSAYATNFRITDAEIRDPSAWYHLVVACDTTQGSNSDRVKLYINGVQQTFRTEATITQNADLGFNQAQAHKIGDAFDGYLAEIHFVDGSQLAASDFGEYDSDNNWNPKDCQSSLTYGTNGFYLKFADNSSAAALGTDSSGNSNTWTVNNLSVASGAGNDSLIDTPTNYTADSGNNGGNYCLLSPLDKNDSPIYSNGNLQVTGSGAAHCVGRSTFGVSSGKWYWEVTINSSLVSTYYPSPGICSMDTAVPSQLGDGTSGHAYMADGQKYTSATLSSYGASFAQNDIIGFALDMDAGTLVAYKNGTSQGTLATGLTGSWSPSWNHYLSTSLIYNFGQRPFTYTPPTGYKALCTANLPDPTIADGSTAMDVRSSLSAQFTINDLGFEPGLVVAKSTSNDEYWIVADKVRNFVGGLRFNDTNVEGSGDAISSVGATGYQSNSNWFTAGRTYATFNWDAGSSTVSNTDGSITSSVRANPPAGFSIVSFTASGTAGSDSCGHGLNAVPGLVIIKRRDAADNWYTWHSSFSNLQRNYLLLDSTAAVALSSNDSWGSGMTSSVIGFRSQGTATGNMIAYCFAPVEGYSAFGSYTGNGSSDGPFVYTGFRIKWLMIKRTDSAANWFIIDAARSPSNEVNDLLYAEQSLAETSNDGNNGIDFLSNGFKLRKGVGGTNVNGSTLIYAAFAEHPFKTSRAR